MANAISTNEKPPVDADWQGVSCEGHLHRAGPLRVEMQMRLVGASRIADQSDRIPCDEPITGSHAHASLAQMADQDVRVAAAENDMVAGRVLAVVGRHAHVGKSIRYVHDLSRARREHRRAKDLVGCGIPWQESRSTET